MRTRILPLLLLATLLAAACYAPAAPAPVPPPPDTPAATGAQAGEDAATAIAQAAANRIPVDALKNATYSGIYDEPITLADGLYEGEPFTEGDPARPTVATVDGAIYNLASSPFLTNVTIAGNAAGGTVVGTGAPPQAPLIPPTGGGILNMTSSKPKIRNSIIWNNEDSSGTGTPSASIRNQDIGSTPTADNSDIQSLASIVGLFYDNTSIDQDPLFVAPLAPARAPSFAGDHGLKGGSPAIDSGLNSFNNLPVDLGQQPRIQGAAIDMGAFEATPAPNVALHKSASTSQAAVGETITYTYQVVNTGAVTLTAITAVDDALGAVTLGAASLPPGSSTAGTLTYTVQASDLPGPLTNTALTSSTSCWWPVTSTTRTSRRPMMSIAAVA